MMLLDNFSYPEIQDEQKVGILMPFRKTPWSGSFRVMVNFCKATKNKEKIIFILFKGKKELKKYVEEEAGIETIFVESDFELKDLVRRKNIKMFVGDDAIPRLKILENVKKETNIKTLIYVQFLYGVHKVFPIFETYSFREKLKNNLLKVYPWFLLRSKFKTSLLKHDFLVANSKSTATLLQLLYGLPVCGVVYPIVDTKVFRQKTKVSEDFVTIYSGSKAGDTSLELIKKVVDLLLDYRKKPHIFGENVDTVKTVIGTWDQSMVFLKNVSDEDLAKIYSQSLLTVAPQKFELFGYVPVESMACGTPTLVFDYLGPSETVLENKTGWKVPSEEVMLGKLEEILKNGYNLDIRKCCREYIEKKFSIHSSVEPLKGNVRDRSGGKFSN